MSKELVARCPFHREGSASRGIYLALAKAKKPMTPMEVAEKTGLPIGQVKNLLLSYRNKYHASPLVRAGARVELCEKGYSLATCKPNAEAKRPPRGLKSKKAPKKSAKVKVKAVKKSKARVKAPKTPFESAPSLESPATPEVVAPNAEQN